MPDQRLYTQRRFQSTLPRRERPEIFAKHTGIPAFQSTLPRRERHCTNEFRRDTKNFNPRSREGSDDSLPDIDPLGEISIHAPAKGATFIVVFVFVVICISIHAPAKGATFLPCSAAYLQIQFQSTLPRRERRGRSKRWQTNL